MACSTTTRGCCRSSGSAVGGRPLELLGGAVGEDNVLFTANLTNAPLPPIGGQSTRQGVIHVERTRLIWEDRLYERVAPAQLRASAGHSCRCGWNSPPTSATCSRCAASTRAARGRVRAAVVDEDSVALSYEGLDGVLRASTHRLRAHTRPTWRPACADFALSLAPELRTDIFYEVGLDAAAPPSRQRFRTGGRACPPGGARRRAAGAPASEQLGRVFSDWLNRSRADLALLTTEFATGPYPYAGIPWFSTAFGRDAIITALQMLWLDPSLARGRAALSGAAPGDTRPRAFTDAAPGKIMHETRKGEMVRLGELPFGRYYGGVDTTPAVRRCWPAPMRSAPATSPWSRSCGRRCSRRMAWVEGDGDADGDGFVDYARGAETGLANQGWKDSEDSVFDEDGRDIEGPVALVEVQGYAFAAFRAMAELAAPARRSRRGVRRLAARRPSGCASGRGAVLGGGARHLRPGAGRPRPTLPGAHVQSPAICCALGCRHRNAARRVAQSAAGQSPSTTGWGLRTLARDEPRYNPMSYHNGSVWPHDTAICTAGIARYGRRDGAAALLSDMFETAVRFDMRLPGAVLRLPAPTGRAADRLSGGLPAAGLGGGLGVHDAAGLPGAHPSTAGAARS